VESLEDAVQGEPESVQAAMAQSLSDVLRALRRSREDEGSALRPVLSGLLDEMEALLDAADREAQSQAATIKTRFERRLAELLEDPGDLADRIVQEVAVLAVRADVREELDRLRTHLSAARGHVASEGPVGRKLDFLTQEFMREANTLCSKSALSALTARGLDLKAVIEQFREQVQNVE
jgi:uncharacterized protein (TIGR00255 family)